MKKIEKVLLAQRTTDGRFLRLHERRHTTDYDFVSRPELAKRIYNNDKNDLLHPKEASYYFENSPRARYYWLKDCVMIPFTIVTETTATKLITY